MDYQLLAALVAIVIIGPIVGLAVGLVATKSAMTEMAEINESRNNSHLRKVNR